MKLRKSLQNYTDYLDLHTATHFIISDDMFDKLMKGNFPLSSTSKQNDIFRGLAPGL